MSRGSFRGPNSFKIASLPWIHALVTIAAPKIVLFRPIAARVEPRRRAFRPMNRGGPSRCGFRGGGSQVQRKFTIRTGRGPMVAKTRSKSARPASFLRVAYSAPAPGESIDAEIRRFTLPATKALTFVKLRAHDQPMLRPESFWHVRPTGKRERDIQIGRQYAHEAIAAM